MLRRLALTALAGLVLATSAHSQPAPPAPPSSTATPRAAEPATEQQWLAHMRQQISRASRVGRDWPPGRHSLVFTFEVAMDGTLSEPTLIVGTGHREIDRAPYDILRRVGALPDFPPDMEGGSQTFRLPLVFDIPEGDAPASRPTVPHWIQDQNRGWKVHAPATMRILNMRERPGFVNVVGISAMPDGPQPLPGRQRLCDVGLQAQQRGLAESKQRDLNADAHQQAIADTLAQRYADTGRVYRADAVSFAGGRILGQEVVVIPSDQPDARRYVAIADTPTYRIALACATTDVDLERSLSLFRAIAANMELQAR